MMIIKLEKRYPLKLFISYMCIYNNNLSVIYFLKNDMIHTHTRKISHTHISQLKLNMRATKRNIVRILYFVVLGIILLTKVYKLFA